MLKNTKSDTADQKVTTTEADKIWSEIKDVKLYMFGLPPVLVSERCEPKAADPNKCYLSYKVSAVVPALEQALGDKYGYETANQYIIVSRK